MTDEVINYGKGQQIRKADIIPVDGTWIHVCPQQQNALMGIGQGEECNWCGATEDSE